MNDCLREPVLFVGEISDDIDLNLPPTSGEDYIKRVVIEAKRCDSVVVAEIDESRLKKPTVNVPALAGCVKAPISLSPSLQWQQCQVADFSDIRLRIAGLRSNIQNGKWKNPSMALPDIDDRSSWLKLCSADVPEGCSESLPTLGIIFSMSHPTIEQVLEYLVEIIDEQEELSLSLGRWVYALLAVLELPLNPDACSCLRTLARCCSKIRAKTNPAQQTQVNALNLFICLVARYFRQLDLADA